MPYEGFQDLPFGGGEPDVRAVGGDGFGGQVDGEVDGGYDSGFLRGWGGAAQRGAHAGEEFVHAERFGDVVVGAGIQGVDLRGFGVPGGQDDDGGARPAAQ